MCFLFIFCVSFSAFYFTQPAMSSQENIDALMATGMPWAAAVKVDEIYSSAINTDITIGTDGVDVKYPAGVVITPQTSYPTPAAGSTLTRKLSIIAAGAPTATYVNLPPASGVVGESRVLAGKASNPVAIVPQGSDTVNAAAAATPFSCAAGTMCECRAITSASWGCK